MLRRVQVWQIMVADGIAGVVAASVLAFLIHFADPAARPMPMPVNTLWAVLGVFTALVLCLAIIRLRVSWKGFSGLLIGTIAMWALGCYAVFLVWINTYGT